MIACLKGYEASNLGIHVTKSSDNKVSKCDVVRKVDADFRLAFWGRVIDEKAASFLGKASCVPLGDNGGMGPSLYLEASGFNNPLRSDCCVAWLIGPMQKKGGDEGTEETKKKRKASWGVPNISM